MLIDFKRIFPQYKIKPEGILHIGANRGEEAQTYYELGIRNVLWIEGNEELIPELSKNVSRYEGQSWIHSLIGDIDMEPTIFHISNNSGQSSSVLQLGTHKNEHPDVHYVKHVPMVTRRIDCLMSAETITHYDFLNVDLQGFDLQAIKGMGDLLNGFKWVYVEVNTTKVYEGCALQNEVEEYLGKFGFKLMETKFLRGCTWGDALFIKQ